jgi:hypothetical protein
MTEESLRMLESVEKETDERLRALKKTKALVGKARRELAKAKKPVATLRKIVADFEAAGRNGADFGQVAGALRRELDRAAERESEGFRDRLSEAAASAGLEVRSVPGGLALGPFLLDVDRAKETASLKFATVEVEGKLPLDAAAIVKRAAKLRSELLEPPADLASLAAEVEEAARVALARQRKLGPAGDLRADLPAVYRELVFIRQGRAKPATKAAFKDYPLARFVVELASLVRSDYNVESPRPVRLETAVIENTRNANKSVFIPNDLSKGYGEGMYYQAIVLRDR